MPNIKSAIKRVKVTKAKTLKNSMIKSRLKTSERRYNEEVARCQEDKTKNNNANIDFNTAEDAMKKVNKALGKAVTKNIIHKNKAARIQSRLAKKFNDLKAVAAK